MFASSDSPSTSTTSDLDVTLSQIKLNHLTTGSRQRSNAILLFSYTFLGKLWISLGYDENGLEETRANDFWNELMNGVDEFLDASRA